jgi:hypothetical protein
MVNMGHDGVVVIERDCHSTPCFVLGRGEDISESYTLTEYPLEVVVQDAQMLFVQ